MECTKDTDLEYPCTCNDMKWVIDNNKLFEYVDPYWLITWIELDKDDKGTNVQRFGLKLNYCPFCGKSLSARKFSKVIKG